MPSLAAAREHALSAEAIHLLILDYESVPECWRSALVISREEQLAWLRAAAARGSWLAVVAYDSRLELYSTRGGFRPALKEVLETLAARIRSTPALASMRVVEKTELLAARHLLQRASGVESGPDTVASIQRAATLSASSTALGLTLSALFRAAGNVARRVRLETCSANPGAPAALIAVEAPAIERIVEEELAAWQAQEAEALRSHADACEAELSRDGSFSAEEPKSLTRLRASLRAEMSHSDARPATRAPLAG